MNDSLKYEDTQQDETTFTSVQSQWKRKPNLIWKNTLEVENLEESIGTFNLRDDLYKIDRGSESYFVEKRIAKRYHQKDNLNNAKIKVSKMDTFEGNEGDSDISNGGLTEDTLQILRSNQKKKKLKKKSKSKDVLSSILSGKTVLSTEQVSNIIKCKLGEKNKLMIQAVVKVLGILQAVKLCRKTLKIQELGGIKTKDKSRFRSSGGIFVYLAQNYPGVNKKELQKCFPQRKRCQRKKKSELNFKWPEQMDSIE